MSLQRSLFRQQAIEFQRHHRQWGDVAALQPLSTRLVGWFLVGSVVTILIFLFIGQYTRKETAVGYLTPRTGTAKIFVPRRGTIKSVDVKEGDIVTEGQPLLTVDTDQIAEDGIDVNVSMLKTLTAQKALLSKNIEAEEQRADSEHQRLTSLAEGLQSEIAQLKDQIALQSERLELANGDLQAANHLRSMGYMTVLEFKKRQVQVLEQKQSISSLRQQLAAQQNRLIETQFSLRQLPTLMAQKVQGLRNDFAATEQRIAELQGRRAYVVRSPSNGRVSTLQATVGQNADPQRLQLEIVPQDTALEAQLFLPTRAVGFVEPGQTVRILYDAFPYQHFGTYTGHVAQVSQTILTSTDAAGPLALKEPAYRITVNLDRQTIEAHGKEVPLQPDMLLKADILLENRPLISWLASPLTGIRM